MNPSGELIFWRRAKPSIENSLMRRWNIGRGRLLHIVVEFDEPCNLLMIQLGIRREFDGVNAPLARLALRNEGLRPLYRDCNLTLGQAGQLSGIPQAPKHLLILLVISGCHATMITAGSAISQNRICKLLDVDSWATISYIGIIANDRSRLVDVGPGKRNRAIVKLATTVLLIALAWPTILLADGRHIPVERVRVGSAPAAGYEEQPNVPYGHVYVPPPPPEPAEQPYGQGYGMEYRYGLQESPRVAPDGRSALAVPRRAGGLGIGLCYTGPLARYFVTDRLAVELRDYIDGDAIVIAPRLMGLFDLPKSEFYEFCYYGVEVGHVNFRGRVSRGGGNTAGFFVGIEKEIFEDVMLNVDAGPYWIDIKDRQTSIRESGVDFVVNSSVVWMLR